MIHPTPHHFFGRQAHRGPGGRWASRADYLAQCREMARRQAEERRRLEAPALGRATRHLVWSTGSAPWVKPLRHLTPTEAAHVRRGNLYTMPIDELAQALVHRRHLEGR